MTYNKAIYLALPIMEVYANALLKRILPHTDEKSLHSVYNTIIYVACECEVYENDLWMCRYSMICVPLVIIQTRVFWVPNIYFLYD